jgi:segregation and condensation protein A
VDEDSAWGEPAKGRPSTRGEEGSPSLTLDGFAGPLDHLLALARAQKIDLAGLSLTTLLDQLTAALRQAPASVPLGQKGDWVVMAAWLVQLRARLLLPADPETQQDATAEADAFRDRLGALQQAQALAGWLEHWPQLGHDVFARGHPPSRAQSPEVSGVPVNASQAVDVIEFLWASLALFDDDAGERDTTSVYRPPLRLELHTVADARERILRQLAETPEGGPLDRFLPDPLAAEDESRPGLRQRSAWSSTFVASLELARQGEAALQQENGSAVINVSSPTGRTNGPGAPQ